jgi:hypothetical protein
MKKYFIDTAFQLFDKDGDGLVSCSEFEQIIKQTTLQKQIPFNLDGQFVRLYFGEKKDRVVTYTEFSQFIHVIKYLFIYFRTCSIKMLTRISTKNMNAKPSADMTLTVKVT